MTESSFLEKAWDAILSRDPALIRKTLQALHPEDQVAVMEHLRKMATEPGWHPEQAASAVAALKALEQEM